VIKNFNPVSTKSIIRRYLLYESITSGESMKTNTITLIIISTLFSTTLYGSPSIRTVKINHHIASHDNRIEHKLDAKRRQLHSRLDSHKRQHRRHRISYTK